MLLGAGAEGRLAALRATGLLGAPVEDRFDRLTRLAQRLLRTPVALVSLLDDRRQFFLSAQGLPEPLASLREMPLSEALCRLVVEEGTPLAVEDAHNDPRLRGIPTVQAYGIGGYLAVPLALPDGCVIGSLCVIALEPRRWTAEEKDAIADLAGAAMAEIAASLRLRELGTTSAALRESEAQLRATFDLAAVGIAHVGLDGRWLRVNARLCAIVGHPEAELTAMRFQDLTHAADLEAELAFLRRLLAGEITTYTMEKRYIRKGGEPVWTNLTVSLVRDEAGAPQRLIAIVEDIAARRAAEAANAHLAAIVASAGDAIVSFAPDDGRILTWNRGAERLFGFTEAEAVGGPVNLVVPSDRPDGGEPTGVFAWALAGHPVTAHETVRLSKSGERIPVAVTATRMLTPGGRVMGVSATFHDLRPRLKAEAALRESEARQRKLQMELLHVSRLSAAGEMASALAHELNQPLTATAAAVRAAQRMIATLPGDRAVSPEIAEAMDLAAEQALRAGQIVRSLRDFVVRDSGDKRVEDLTKLVTDAAALALIGARERGIRAEYRFDPQLPPVLVDGIQIQQVLLNLVRNALEAMASGAAANGAAPRQGELAVTAACGASGTVEVAVADTGPGVAPEIAGRLFNSFVSTKPGGMGMGLSVSRSIVEGHGGRLWVEPNPGGGSVFRFTLPAATADLAA